MSIFSYEKVLIAGCAQEFSSFNPVECEYEIFHIIQGNEIYDYHLGKILILEEQLKK